MASLDEGVQVNEVWLSAGRLLYKRPRRDVVLRLDADIIHDDPKWCGLLAAWASEHIENLKYIAREAFKKSEYHAWDATIKKMPDADIISVWMKPEWNSLCLLLTHSDFPICRPGEECLRIILVDRPYEPKVEL